MKSGNATIESKSSQNLTTSPVTTTATVQKDAKVTIEITDIAPQFAATATADQIQDALNQKDAQVTVKKLPAGKVIVPKGAKLTMDTSSEIAKDTVIEVNDGATLDMSDATTVADGAKVNVAKGAAVTLPNGTKLDSSSVAAECALELTAAGGGVTVSVPEGGKVVLKTNVKLGAKDKIILGKGAVLEGSGSETLEVATKGSVSGDVKNFYQNGGTGAETEVQAKTYTWTTDKWVANS